MKKYIINITSMLIVLTMAIMFTNCGGDDPHLIGVDILDDNYFETLYTDTITLHSHSFIYDSLNSGNIRDEYGNMLGAIYDETMGKTTSMLAVSYHLNSLSQSLAYNPVTDSVVVSFAYNSLYGDDNYVHSFRIFELEEQLNKDSVYYSFYRVQHSFVELSYATFLPSLDTVIIGQEKFSPSFKMNIDKSFGEKIFSFPQSAFESNEEFVKHFKGLYVVPDPVNTPNSGSFLKLALNNNQTYINVYYHNDTASNLVFKLIVENDSPKFMEYEHYNYQHASSGFKEQVLNNNNTLGDNTIYLQSFAGIASKISFPYINEMCSNYLAVNEAEITFNVDNTDTYFGIPLYYELVRRNESGNMVTIPDYMEGSGFYDGMATSQGTITFRITRHIQAVLSGKYADSDLYLHIRNSAYSPGRAVLNGVNTDKSIKFKMTYSYVKK